MTIFQPLSRASSISSSLQPPSGPTKATILFTDLVGSTGALARLVEERAEKLRQMHFSVLREAISRTQGTEVKNLGDGLMVAFAAASDAVADRPAGHRRLSR